MPTAYNTEYQLTSADITALHALASPGGLLPSSVSTWQQQQAVSQQPPQQPQQQPQPTAAQQQQQINLSSLVMWGVDKQSSDLCSQVSSLAANLSVGSPSNLLLGRDEWLGRPVTHLPQGAMLTVNTSSGVSIKSEPVSPGRDRSTPCPPPSSSTPVSSSGGILNAPPQYPGSLLCLEPPTGRSPADSVSSNASSFEGSDRDDTGGGGGGGGGSGTSINPADLLIRASEQEQEGGNVKRMRLDAWAT
ncbi:myocyte-specific enhancer factor 2D-like isoform X1 [Boleophthalmus pectinirostris]|uniref:myocyte-specific enhancer factor 2D-like isoform X1 n=1 Tax=Boleophthalmus pectinirostris TaxID=150288 RepID=UPI00242D0126|nr:myocyte-specific enhancer factor 2D-like isoform X1 [Boleophthalmus pectinirostris]